MLKAKRGMRFALLVAVAGLASGCDGSDYPVSDPASSSQLRGTSLRVVSGRADMVTGGNALVEITLPTGADMSQLRVLAGLRDASNAFRRLPDGRVLGLVTGLLPGQNDIEVTARDRSFAGATLTVRNTGVNAPTLLASHLTPYYCATPVPVAATATEPGRSGSGLSKPATDATCTTPSETRLWYRTRVAVSAQTGDGGCSFVIPDPSPAAGSSTPPPTPANSCFQPYVPGQTSAALVAQTTPQGGTAMPYIVRVERGVINRGIYEIAVLFDPTKPWSFSAPQPQWNHKVVHLFGGSTGQPRLQVRPNSSWINDDALGRGFMVVVNSLTDSANNSNRVLVAETTMKMKEHIVENYGELSYYSGLGGSGGAINQNTVASIYPGLLDGLQILYDFPDGVSTGIEVADCVQLVNFYASPQWTQLMQSQGLSQDQINAKKAAINGHADQLGCHSWANAFGNANKPGNYRPVFVANAAGALFQSPVATNNCNLPAGMVYDRNTNPNGIRCSDADASVAVFGTAAGTNRARQTIDNVGVQYGLKALLAGKITAEEFVTLNEGVGGSDADSELRAERSVADTEALTIAYRSGVLVGGSQVGRVPIIDQRGYDEQGIHYIWRSFSERERINRANGDFANQVMWRTPYGPTAPSWPLRSLLTLDSWLTALNSSAPKASVNAVRTHAQVVAAKPSTAYDFCHLSTDVTFSTEVRDFSVCNRDPRLAPNSSPRQVAGGPITEDVLKCQLKALNFADYVGITFSPAQQARLRAVFASGVCDWSRPGVNQVAEASPLTFAAGPGGVPFPAEPVSIPIR